MDSKEFQLSLQQQRLICLITKMSLCPAKALERQIHHEMLINALAYEKMNDLKDASDKSSQKWLC